MWNKAPAVKEKPEKAAAGKAQTVPAVDADAALRSAQQVSHCLHSFHEPEGISQYVYLV